MPEFRDSHRRRRITKRILDDNLVLRFAKNEADTRLVARVFEKVVNRSKVEIHFAGVLRFKSGSFQVDHDKASETQAVKEKMAIFAQPLEKV